MLRKIYVLTLTADSGSWAHEFGDPWTKGWSIGNSFSGSWYMDESVSSRQQNFWSQSWAGSWFKSR